MRIKWLIYILPLLILSACVEPYVLEDNNYEQSLVVDGGIDNGDGPYVIKLSTTTSISKVSYAPLADCKVFIESTAGEMVELTETSLGEYSTTQNSIKGEVGIGYKLHITTSENKEYESDFEYILPSVAIDSVYYEPETKDDPSSVFDLNGYQFYVDSKTPESDTNYLLWQLVQTYKYNADFLLDYFYAGSLYANPTPEMYFTCYKTENVNEVFTYSTVGQSLPEIKRQALHYVDTRTKALSIRYTVLVNQRSVSKKAFEYWNQIKQINEAQGAVFAQQPFQVRGNIKNVNDAQESVLGFFMASGVDSKRVFVPTYLLPMDYNVCVVSDADKMLYGMIRYTRPSEWPVWVTNGDGTGRAIMDHYCMDCRLAGGVLEKPDFWID